MTDRPARGEASSSGPSVPSELSAQSRQSAQSERSAFESRSRELLEQSAAGLSAHVRSRLTQARHQAAAEIVRNRGRSLRWGLPAGVFATAAGVAVVVLLVTNPFGSDPTGPAALNTGATPDADAMPAFMTNGVIADFDLLVDGEALDLAASGEPAFFEWAAAQLATDEGSS